MEKDWIVIGQIVAAQGLKGELRVNPSSDFPERFEVSGQRWLQMPNQEPRAVELLTGYQIPGKNLYVIKLEGIHDRTQAESLKNGLLMVKSSDRPVLDEDEFHVQDLIGLLVVDQNTQQELGIVTNLYSAGQDLLEVTQAATETEEKQQFLVPFVKAIVPVVDLKNGRIEVDPPAGLFE